MSAIAPKLMTAEEFADVGDPMASEPFFVGPAHTVIAARFARHLAIHVEVNDLGVVASNDTFEASDGLNGVEVAFWSAMRIPRVPLIDRPIFKAPALVVMATPSRRWLDVSRRMNYHFDRDVSIVAVVDMKCSAVLVNHENRFPDRFRRNEMVVFPDVLPIFAVRVASLFEDEAQ